MRQPPVRTRRVVGGLATTVAACLGVAISTLIIEILALLVSVEGGFMLCPDGGDEIWTRPGVLEYFVPVLVGVGLSALLAWRLKRRFVRIGAAYPTVAACVLAGLSAGSTAAYLIAAVYADHMYQPDRFRCGNPWREGHVPGIVLPVLVAAYAAALTASIALTAVVRARGRAAR